MTAIDIWHGSREFLVTTVLDEATTPATVLQSYDVAILLFSTSIDTAAWSSVTTYAGNRGLWADGLATGSYRVFARVGTGSPNERTITPIGTFNVRTR